MGVLSNLVTGPKQVTAPIVDQTQGALGAASYGTGQQAVGAINDLRGMSGMNTAAGQLGLGGVQSGLGSVAGAQSGLGGLAGELQRRVNGTAGPSIAEQQLAQSLGQVQQQGAGSLAAARGVSPGTAARLISANQTNAAQQAAGQGAILRSQEQQAAENQLANVFGTSGQLGLGQQQIGFGGFGTGANAAAQAAGTIGGLTNDQGRLALATAQGNQNAQMGAQVANQSADNAMLGGLLNGAGGAIGMFAGKGHAHGGEITVEDAAPSLAHHLMASHKHLASAHEALAKYAAGGEVQYAPKSMRENAPSESVAADAEGDEEETPFERHLKERDRARESNKEQDTQNTMRNLGETVQNKAKGGTVKPKPVFVPHEGPMDVSPSAGQTSAEPGVEGTDSEGKKKSLKLAEGGDVGSLYAEGGHVPGQAEHPGDDSRNDTVPTMLSPGEVVLPRTISHDPEAAADFVRHINARKGAGPEGGFAKVLASHRDLHSRLSALEARLGGRK